jgi:hypothetical protein
MTQKGPANGLGEITNYERQAHVCVRSTHHTVTRAATEAHHSEIPSSARLDPVDRGTGQGVFDAPNIASRLEFA